MTVVSELSSTHRIRQ